MRLCEWNQFSWSVLTLGFFLCKEILIFSVVYWNVFHFSSHGLKYVLLQQLGRPNVTWYKRARLRRIQTASFLRKELSLTTLTFLYMNVPETNCHTINICWVNDILGYLLALIRSGKIAYYIWDTKNTYSYLIILVHS